MRLKLQKGRLPSMNYSNQNRFSKAQGQEMLRTIEHSLNKINRDHDATVLLSDTADQKLNHIGQEIIKLKKNAAKLKQEIALSALMIEEEKKAEREAAEKAASTSR